MRVVIILTSLSARSYSTFPCAYQGTATLPLPMSYRSAHHSAANIALDLRGFDNFDAFSAAVRPNLLRFCVNNYQLEQNSESKAASHDVMSSSSVGVAAQILPGTEEESRNRHASTGRSSEGSQAARGDAREDTKEASIAACAAELEAYLNWHVIDACDDFDDDDAALPA